MVETCTFHRKKPAHFQCHECGSSYCEACVTVRDTVEMSGNNRYYFCPACNVPATVLSIGNMIEPFWQRLTGFFLYPLQPTPLLLVLVLSILGALLPANILVQIFIWVVMVKYSFAALATTAQGGLKAPQVTWKLLNDDINIVFKQYVLYGILIVVGSMVFAKTGMIGGLAFVLCAALSLPAIIMLLVATNSVIRSLNPMLIFPVIFRIGWPYLLMYLYLTFLLSGPAALLSYLPTGLLSEQLWAFITLFCKQYYAVISYHLMGYVLLQYHQEIGYSVDYDFFMANRGNKIKQQRPLSPEDELKNGLAILIRMGRYEEAINRLTPHIRGKDVDADADLSEKYLQLLRMTNNEQEAERYAIHHLELLVKQQKKKKALDFYTEIRKVGTDIPAPENVLTLASWFQQRQEFRKAITTHAYFIKQFKNHPNLPESYFQLAKLLHERGNNSAKAKQIMAAIIKRYPKHDLSGEAKAYLTFLA